MKYKGKKMTRHRVRQLQWAKIYRDYKIRSAYGLYLTPNQIEMIKRGVLKW